MKKLIQAGAAALLVGLFVSCASGPTPAQLALQEEKANTGTDNALAATLNSILEDDQIVTALEMVGQENQGAALAAARDAANGVLVNVRPAALTAAVAVPFEAGGQAARQAGRRGARAAGGAVAGLIPGVGGAVAGVAAGAVEGAVGGLVDAAVADAEVVARQAGAQAVFQLARANALATAMAAIEGMIPDQSLEG